MKKTNIIKMTPENIAVPMWVDYLSELVANNSEEIIGSIQAYENEVREIVLDDEKRKLYNSNYEKFYNGNCIGCVTSLMCCGYLGEGSENKLNKFKSVLEGKAEKCSIRASGIHVYIAEGKGKGFHEVDLRD